MKQLKSKFALPTSIARKATHAIYLFVLLGAHLLPVSLDAQSSDTLHTQIQQHVSCDGCDPAQNYDYANVQDVPAASLTEDHTLSNDHSDSFQHVSTKFGAADATLVGNSYGTSGTLIYVGHTDGNSGAAWTDTTTISSPGLEGQSVIVRQTVHVYGGLTINASETAYAHIGYRIAITPVGITYQGDWDSQAGFSGTPMASLETFTYDRQVTIGQPFSSFYDAEIDGKSIGGQNDVAGEGHVSGNITLRTDAPVFIDPNTNQPINFTSTSSEGGARGQVTPSGTSYGGFSLTNTAPGRFNSTFQVLDGTATRITFVHVGFVSAPDSEITLASDVATLKGIGADQFVAQMNYDPGVAGGFPGGENAARLAYLDPSTGKWANAVLGNNGGAPKLIQGAYDPSADFHLGYYGVDTVHHVVWAVLNYDGEFGVGAVGEPQLAGPINSFSANVPISAGAQVHFTANAGPGFNLRVQFATPPGTSSTIDESSWQDLLDGGLMIEQPANSGNYVLDSSAYPAGTNVYFRVVASKHGFIANPGSKLGPYTLHPNPGLSPTIFTVDESNAPAIGLADSVLRFAATQIKRPAGLIVHVEASTDGGATWQLLQDNNNGQMGFDPLINQFVLNSTSYPKVAGVRFRAVSTGAGCPNSISNAVGDFDLTSNVAHIPPPVLYLIANGHVADFDFRAKYDVPQDNVRVRVQYSTMPADESSWTQFDETGFALMTKTTDPSIYRYLLNQSPFQGSNIFFRAKAEPENAMQAASGFSMPMGPFTLTSVLPPQVVLHVSGTGGGTGTPNDPLILRGDRLHVTMDTVVATGHTLAALLVQLDGQVVPQTSEGSAVVDVPTPLIGDHVLQGFALDDMGVIGRAIGALFIRVMPPTTSGAKKASGSESATQAAADSRTWVAVKDGRFDDPSVWRNPLGEQGVPGGLHDAIFIGSHTINIDHVFTGVETCSINGGRLVGDLTVTAYDVPNTGGTIEVSSLTTIVGSATFEGWCRLASFGVCELDNVDDLKFIPNGAGIAGLFDTYGICNLHGSGGVRGAHEFRILGDFNPLPPLSSLALDYAASSPDIGDRILDGVQLPGGRSGSSGTEKTVPAVNGSALTRISALAGIQGEHSSGILANDGATVVSHDGGTVVSHDGGTVVSHDGGTVVSHDGGTVVNPDGVTSPVKRSNRPAGERVSSDTRSRVTQGTGNIFMQGADPITISGGEVSLDGVTLIGSVVLNDGILSGGGVIYGDLTNNGGYISPGHSAAHLIVTGNFAQGSNGTLIVENGGFFPSDYDVLQVGGKATLGGKLDVKTINGYEPGTSDTFTPVMFASATGSFASVSSDAQIATSGTGLITSVDIAKPQPRTGQPLNIATRLAIQGGDNILIAGFIVTGPSGATKKVLIRGIGPSLTNAGVSGAIQDPLLELHKPDGAVVVNDNWQQGDTSQIPNGFAPSDSRESVIVATLTPGTYTAVVKGAHGETGVGLAEIYDLESGSTAKLANIATRGFVQTGDSVLIGGFIIGGTEPAKVLVRAIGPSLAAFGVPNTLPATTLEVHDANGDVISNDGWRSTQESEIIATTIPPTNDNESAILATLVPGTYTAVIRGRNNTTGIAVIEAYNLQ
jgi:hypothetical protein